MIRQISLLNPIIPTGLCMVILMLMGTTVMMGQSDDTSFVAEINEQVWAPFKHAYETRNAELFNSLHTDDALRITEGGITPGPEYKARITEGFQRKFDGTITIDFAHEHRLYYGDLGYEVGYYRISYNRPGQEETNSYGRFHVLLRKIDGTWKIAQDWDTEMVGSHKISEIEFLGAQSLKVD